MNEGHYFNCDSVVELGSKTLRDAVRELLLACKFRGNVDDTMEQLLTSENEISSCVGNKIALLNVRINTSSPCEILVGRASGGVKCGSGRDSEIVTTVVVLLVSKHERNYLDILATLVNVLQSQSVGNKLLAAKSFDAFKAVLSKIFKSVKNTKNNKFSANELFLRNSVDIASRAKCTSVMLFADIAVDSIEMEEIFDDIRLIRVSQSNPEVEPIFHDSHIELQVKIGPPNWTHGFRGAILFGITREIIACDEKICCIGCNATLDLLDTLFIIDVQKEFRPVFTSSAKLLQCEIKPEVLERTLSIASEIAAEGREGKPVGCLFVVGDISKISLFMKPLVLNPFYGYPEGDRNILNPFMDETVKEFSLIDGAFVIRGDGIIESAGTLIYTPNHNIIMPSGFGARHAAAASISWAAGCIAIAISESTRNVTLFQNGQMLQIM
ncbi:MAG: diadenylate cyclase [Puniceicoccales bacterium]|jgi:DNA integrity scanning protein DisA with diadenylate cyclase activity/mannitol/fructose-specific phosphotransferase system IIA component (Ntr-type)|nr:diadenylate cyclase [Puniceicoccales bacterium]